MDRVILIEVMDDAPIQLNASGDGRGRRGNKETSFKLNDFRSGFGLLNGTSTKSKPNTNDKESRLSTEPITEHETLRQISYRNLAESPTRVYILREPGRKIPGYVKWFAGTGKFIWIDNSPSADDAKRDQLKLWATNETQSAAMLSLAAAVSASFSSLRDWFAVFVARNQ